MAIKVHRHLLQRSGDSVVECVNAEVGIFLSLCQRNRLPHSKASNGASVNEP